MPCRRKYGKAVSEEYAPSTKVRRRLEQMSSNLQKKEKKEYTVTSGKRKYCSCVAKVAKKQKPSCLRGRKWRKGCYNPYAICGRLRPRGMKGGCVEHYDLEDDELVTSMAALHGKSKSDYLTKALAEIALAKKSPRYYQYIYAHTSFRKKQGDADGGSV